MDVRTKICKRLNNFNIVTSHSHIGAQWEGGVSSLNHLWTGLYFLMLCMVFFMLHFICMHTRLEVFGFTQSKDVIIGAPFLRYRIFNHLVSRIAAQGWSCYLTICDG